MIVNQQEIEDRLMKKYFYSLMLHIAAIIVLLLFVRWTPDTSTTPVEHVIVVDFTNRPELNKPRSKPQAQKSQPTKPKENTVPQPIKAQIPKEAPKQSQKQQEQPKPSEAAPKADVKSTAHVDQEKIRAAEQLAKERQQEALAKAKAEAERAKAEAEKAKKEAEKAESKSFFDNLIKDSKKKADAAEKAAAEAAKQSESQANLVSSSDAGLSDDISSRQVLKKPNIVDNTQKEGRVVVKICVDGSGKVISASYTQVGSTTTDAHLIDLAEKGVMEYIFSQSPAERQCGRVFIDFRLRA